MANPSSFLKSPFAVLAEQEQARLLPGSEAVKEVDIPEFEAAAPSAAPTAQIEPALTPAAPSRNGRKVSLAPPPELRQVFEVTAQHFNVPANVLMAIAQQESSYNNDVTNKETGAAGIGQYMHATAKSLKINARDPNEAIPAIAMQLKERIDKGMSLDDAIREHFAGPNRKGWGPKTAAYGTEVLAKAEQIGNELYDEPAPVEQPKAQNQFAPDRLSRTDYEKNFRALNPQAAQGAVDMAMAQYDEQAKTRTQAKGNAVQSRFDTLQSPEAMFNERLNQRLQAGNAGVAQAAPSRQQPNDVNTQPTRERPGIIDQAQADFGRGIANLRALGYGAAGVAADQAGDEELAARLLDEYVGIQDEIAKTNPATIGTYKNVKSLGDAGRYAIEAVAENLPMLLPSLVTGGVGAQVAKKGAEKLVGGMIEAQIAKGVAREVAERQAAQFIAKRVLAGSIAGAAPASVGMEAGAIGGDIYKETGRVESGTAIAYGIPAGLLDTIGPVMALRKIAGPIVDEVAGSVIRRLGAEAGKQFLAEAGTEGLQAIIEQAATAKEASRDLWTPELLDNVIDAALKGGIGGGVMGGVSQSVAEVRSAGAQPQANPQPQERIEPTMGEVPAQPGTDQNAIPANAGVDPDAAPDQLQVNDEGFSGQIMGDDGLMHSIDSRTGVTMTEAPAEPAGPLEAALLDAAEQHAADPAPAPVIPAAEPAAPDYTTMEIADLRANLKRVAEQAKASPEARKQMAQERKTIEREISARGKQAVADSKPAEEALTAGPFPDIKAANQMMVRYASETGVPHEVVGAEGSYAVQPIGEQDAARNGNANGRGRSSGDASGLGSSDGVRRTGVGDSVVERSSADAERGSDASVDSVRATIPADAQPALTPYHERNPYHAYSFPDKAKADAFTERRGVDTSKFEVIQTGPVRWQVKPRAATVEESFATEQEAAADVSERPQVPEETSTPSSAEGTRQEADSPEPKPKREPSSIEREASTPSSWVIRNKDTGDVVLETSDPEKVAALNTEKYEAIPILKHLQEINDSVSKAGQAARSSAVAAEPTKPKRVETESAKAIRTRNERQEAAVKKATKNESKRKNEILPKPARKVLEVERDSKESAAYKIMDDDGKRIGSIDVQKRTTYVGDDTVEVSQIHNAGIDDLGSKGKGYGIRAYTELVDQALAGGGQVWSDPSVSLEAQRMYTALKRRGYKVEQNKAKPPVRGEDGTLTSDGSYVYKVTGKNDDTRYSVSDDDRVPSKALKSSVITQWGKIAEPIEGYIFLSARNKKNNRGIFIIDGKFDRDAFKKVMGEATAAGLDTKKLYIVAESAPYSSTAIDLQKFADYAEGSITGRKGEADFSISDLDQQLIFPISPVIKKLGDAGKIVLHEDASTLPLQGKAPAGTQAMTARDGTIHVVASNLDENAMGVVLHEAFHSGAQSLVSGKAWQDLMKRLDRMYRQAEQSSGKAREFFDAARARVKTAQARGAVAEGMQAEEFGAYAIEEYTRAPATTRKWVDDLLGAVKAWTLRRFGAQLGQVTPAQLSSLAQLALADVQSTRANEAFSLNDARTVEVDGVRHPIRDSEGKLVAEDFAGQMEFWKNYDGPVDEAGRPILNDDGNRFSVSGSPQPRSLTPAEQGIARKVQAQIQDNQNRLNQVQAKIREVTGVQELGNADAYRAEANRPGRVAVRKEDARDKLFEPMMRRLAKAGFKPKQLETLLHAQHAKERNAAIAKINPEHDPASPRYTGTQGSGMNDDVADRIIEQHKGDAALLAIADEARSIAQSTLDLKREYGLITDAQYDSLSITYDNYVPLKGDGEYGPKVKRATGHGERDENILQNIARDYEQALVVGEKNLARTSLLQMVLQFADDALWTARVPPRGRYVAGTVFEVSKKGSGEVVASYTSQSQVAAWLESKGTEASQYEVNTSGGERVAEFTKPLQDNEIMVYIKGDPVRIQIYDETLARQLRPLRGEQMNVILEGMRAHNRYLSMIFTGYNPTFIFKNASRDMITGTVNMTGNHGAVTTAKAWAKYPAAWAALFKWAVTKKIPSGEMGRILTEYRAQGGKTGASYMSDLEEQGKNLQRMFDDAKGVSGYAAEGKVGKASLIAGRKAIMGLAHTVEVLNQAFENALRLALFAQLRAEGKAPGIAAAAAKNVTVNFDRKGVMTPQMSAFYLFINPAIQGTANMSRTLTSGEHKYQAWALTGMMAAAGFAAAIHGMDDDKDRWLGQSWTDRTKNIRIRVGETTLNLPFSYEFAPFYAMGVAMGEASRGESSIRSAVRAFSSFLDAYYPMQGTGNIESDNYGLDLLLAHVPTVAKVPAQSWLNRSSFGGKVVPETDNTKNRPDNLKLNRNTKGSPYDATAQLIAQAGELVGADKYSNDLSKVSPETLKLIYTTYTGGLGRFIADSAGLASFSTQGDVDIGVADVPVLKDFVKPDTIAPIRSRYFDLSREAKKSIDEFAQAKKMLDGPAMRAIAQDPERRTHLAMAKMIKSVNEVQGLYGDRAVAINADKSLTTGQKRAQLKELEEEQEAIYKKAIEAFRQ